MLTEMTTLRNRTIAELRQELRETAEELREMSSGSYSQSNAGYMLTMRALRRKKERLEARILAAIAEEAKEEAGDPETRA